MIINKSHIGTHYQTEAYEIIGLSTQSCGETMTIELFDPVSLMLLCAIRISSASLI